MGELSNRLHYAAGSERLKGDWRTKRLLEEAARALSQESYMRDHDKQQQGCAAERARIVEFLRAGVDVVRRQTYPRDREMHGYYLALADRIEAGDHVI